MTPGSARRPSVIELAARVRAWHWMAAGTAVLAVDYATGPAIQFPMLFIVPVALATASHGVGVGGLVGALLPLLRLSMFTGWGVPAGWLHVLDALVDVAILIGFATLIARLLRQQREIQVLTGLLPICSFCKRIREASGEWRQLESYIADRSEARFSHTFCPDCGRVQYPGMVD